ncbi:MAG: type II toxin-antitoxin system RelE/ParE family toxin [Caulobacter sp.]|nr:type II toxin-antitoxin system RelE/ParE family toxin [Caulobacter sp.]
MAFDKPNAAEQLAERLWQAGESLSTFPDRGRLIPSGVRELTHVRPYLIRYVRIGRTVLIFEIVHSARRPLP